MLKMLLMIYIARFCKYFEKISNKPKIDLCYSKLSRYKYLNENNLFILGIYTMIKYVLWLFKTVQISDIFF